MSRKWLNYMSATRIAEEYLKSSGARIAEDYARSSATRIAEDYAGSGGGKALAAFANSQSGMALAQYAAKSVTQAMQEHLDSQSIEELTKHVAKPAMQAAQEHFTASGLGLVSPAFSVEATPVYFDTEAERRQRVDSKKLADFQRRLEWLKQDVAPVLSIEEIVMLWEQRPHEQTRRAEHAELIIKRHAQGFLDFRVYPDALGVGQAAYFPSLPMREKVKARIHINDFEKLAVAGRLGDSAPEFVLYWREMIEGCTPQYSVLGGVERTVNQRSVKKKSEQQCDAMWAVIEKEGYNPKTFQVGLGALTVEQLMNKCIEFDNKLFIRPRAKDPVKSFRSVWESFKVWRERK